MVILSSGIVFQENVKSDLFFLDSCKHCDKDEMFHVKNFISITLFYYSVKYTY